MRNLFFAFIIVSSFLLSSGCSSPTAEHPGTEYMPDMFHSIAYEANLADYYYYNTWGSEQDYYKVAGPRKPVHGTIPRGFASGGSGKHFNGMATNNSIVVPANGSVPYYYEDTDAGRASATAELVNNPYPITADGLERGKNLYDINCGICHGAKADGAGWLYDTDLNPDAKYPAAPANFLSDEFVAASNGRYYHGIMYGKNVMGGYADKLSYEERWQVIHYIRSLQAKAGNLAYNEKENTLNAVDMPGASAQYISYKASTNKGYDVHGDGSLMIKGDVNVKHSDGTHHATGTVHEGTAGHSVEYGTDHSIEHAAGTTVEGGKKKFIEKVKEAGGKATDAVKDAGGKLKDKVKGAGGKLKGAINKNKGGDNDHDE